MDLTSKQRQYLKGLAHSLSPAVRIGKNGYTEAVVEETRTALLRRELIKVRIEVGDGTAREDMAEQLAADTDAALVDSIGKISVLYRRREEEPGIVLPG